MRYLLFLLSIGGLLTACEGVRSGPRIDFVGATRFTSSDRILTAGGDTISTLVYANNRDEPGSVNPKNPLLRHLSIWVDYDPSAAPVVYPAGATSNANLDLPKQQLYYLDQTFSEANPIAEFAFQQRFTARTTSGRETWHYEITDANGDKASRSYRLTVRKADSALVYHNYALVLEAPAPNNWARRSYLDLPDGLTLSSYSTSIDSVVQSTTANRRLVNLVYCQNPVDNSFFLAAPNDAEALKLPGLRLGKWAPDSRNATELRTTSLNTAAFNTIATEAGILATYDAGTGSASRTVPVVAGQVYAFKITDNNNPSNNDRKGLILIEEVYRTTNPSVRIRVKVNKRTVR